ncbi:MULTISPECIES: hypothetical protein [unclassified Achromobacter]|uniref:hypothetical protein n=1 Tax=unclassified Achromobacter TaxID=2626865 RepID=UPI001E3650EE|nr:MULTISPECIES: hypothetical protein [unclassified Achromobacter]
MKSSKNVKRQSARYALGAMLLTALATLAGCAPTGGSSTLPSLGKMFSSGLSFSPSVNVAKNMEGHTIDDAITALGEPNKTSPDGDSMILEWSDYQTSPYQAWVVDGSSSQMVGMIPASNGVAATPVMQTTNYGHYENRTAVYQCGVYMRMKDSVITETKVQGNVCPDFIGALRKWAGEKEDKNYMN